VSDLLSQDPGLSVFFRCEVDGVDLGDWTTCTGLGISIQSEVRTDSAMAFLQHHLPGRVTFDNITLTRPISSETDRIVSWVSGFALMPVPTVAQITALSPERKPIITFNLMGVIPVRWTGPSFDAASLQIAEEKLELAFKGFM
jgi:phage tail-like protein